MVMIRKERGVLERRGREDFAEGAKEDKKVQKF
jgi:hypothetical protein